ncbi:uncharacterized protein BX663DRAFT_487986 [Cokeromyces recurvatus]|uniref:uncharacterized protein n=1 Tax=Cokeromyces recurvatus TaxID=90255 RepID=UPI00221FC811|nr:uncharacterized protein BX663DRAFT_487986 [Cokeromyces recurvatus]KAI7901014.1 hypothetical protein BX663DRAFT_487986 [Cokeromyces recurvatus]
MKLSRDLEKDNSSFVIASIKKDEQSDDESEEEETIVKKVIIFEKYLFFIGFLCPLAWFLGSSTCRGRRVSDQHFYHPAIFLWKKRCRIAATLSLTIFIVIAAVVMVVNPKLFGLKTDYATGAQTSSASNNAIRPGVPIIGTNDWGDTVAGISVDNNM